MSRFPRFEFGGARWTSRRPHVGLWLALVSIGALWAGSAAWSHDFTLTDVLLVVRGDGRIQADMIVDLDALAVGAPQGSGSQGHDGLLLAERLRALDEEELSRLRASLLRTFERRVRIRVDGEPVPVRISFPDEGRNWVPQVDPAGADGALGGAADSGEDGTDRAAVPAPGEDAFSPSYFGVTARLEALAPQDAETVSFFASRAFRAVHLSLLQQRSRAVERQVLTPGEESRDFELTLAMAPPDFETARAEERGEQSAEGRGAGFLEFLRLGVLHIVPRGLDHVLFVLSLCLLSTRWRDLAIWVTSFTLAHTVSLALSSKNLLVASPALVEPLIAVSIGWVAFRALRRVQAPRPDADSPTEWRSEAALVFCLGLLHGFGFAGVLRGIGLPQEGWWLALAGFNLGVELGQVLVLLGGLLVLSAVARWTPWRRAVVMMSAWALIVVSAWWTLERIGWLPASF